MTENTSRPVMNFKNVFEKQREFKWELKKSDHSYRISKLKQFKEALLERKTEVAKAIREDFGKPQVETDLTEIMPVLSMINLMEKNLASWMKDEKVKAPLLFKGTSSWVRKEARGNCLIVSPWNYPFQLTVYPLLTAFAAGNTCVVKPSEFTPHTNKITRALCEAVFTTEEVAFFEGGSELSTELLKLPFDHIFFTGSTPVGKIVAEAAAKNLASISLELGGKSPCVIDRVNDLEEMCEKIAWGKLVNGGQTCVAPDYLVVYKDQLDSVVSCLKKNIKSFYNESYEVSNDYCRIITPRHGERLARLVEDAHKKGAELALGGKYHHKKRVMEPTVLINVTKDMEVMQEEIFGPILPIFAAESKEEMLQFVNSFDNPLAFYVFTEDKSFENYFLENTYSGGATINDTLIGVGHPYLPFGGAGKSGIGKYHGKYGFDEFSNLRSVTKRKSDLGTTYFYPPYSEKKEGIVDSLLRKLTKIF